MDFWAEMAWAEQGAYSYYFSFFVFLLMKCVYKFSRCKINPYCFSIKVKYLSVLLLAIMHDYIFLKEKYVMMLEFLIMQLGFS